MFMSFWSFFICPGAKHDEENSNCSSTPQDHKEYITPAILLNETVSNSDDLILVADKLYLYTVKKSV